MASLTTCLTGAVQKGAQHWWAWGGEAVWELEGSCAARGALPLPATASWKHNLRKSCNSLVSSTSIGCSMSYGSQQVSFWLVFGSNLMIWGHVIAGSERLCSWDVLHRCHQQLLAPDLLICDCPEDHLGSGKCSSVLLDKHSSGTAWWA